MYQKQQYENAFVHPESDRILRVAAYIRVSSENENQEDSYETQKLYFEEVLSCNPGWMSAGVYADYGTSGTSRHCRTGFNRLMRHCEEGRIDRIVTKSISRFARNTRDFLKALKVLKENHITIAFEKENLDTAYIQSEVLLTAFGAVAQEESRSISANVRWGLEKRCRRGEARNYQIYGYRYADGENDRERTESGYTYRKIVICEEEAAVVRRIFTEAAGGKRYIEIARGLNYDRIPAPDSPASRARRQMTKTPAGVLKPGLEKGWTGGHIGQIIRLERYAGDVRMVKTYTPDYKTHKAVVNRGEREQYYVRDHHPAIISRELFEAVQDIRAYNSEKMRNRGSERTVYPFSGRLVCKHCGRFYHTKNRSSHALWYCPSSANYTGRQVCTAERIYEEQLIRMCRKAIFCRFGPALGLADDKEEEEAMFGGHYVRPACGMAAEDRDLVQNLLEKLEALQLADTMEHDRSFLHTQIAKSLDEADRAGQTLEALRANLEVLKTRRDILGERVDSEELAALREYMLGTEKTLEESMRRAEELKRQLQEMECYWKALEADYEWRQRAVAWLRTLPAGPQGMADFLNGLTSEYVKAFILSIEVESPLLYRIRWFDDTWTEVEMFTDIE